MTVPQIRTRPAPDLEVPQIFSRLRDIVYNLWWSWSPEAHVLFNRLAPASWQHYRNPIDVLIDLGPERWSALQADDDFARAYRALVKRFQAYVEPEQPTWFQRHHGDYAGGPFVYFSTEYGWHECLHTYSGGLGVLSGDHSKSASDLGLPFIGVGLMYRHGYFRQTIDAEGFQQHVYPDYDLQRLPLQRVVDGAGRELHIPVEVAGRSVYVRVWRAQIGRVPVLLLDADLPINHPADRAITTTLYVRGREMRLCQEILLGMGGVRVLQALGITPGAWHVNEGHSALLGLLRASEELSREPGSLKQAARRVARNTVFTTHTPVTAGNEKFDEGLVRDHFKGWSVANGIDLEELLAMARDPGQPEDRSFNMTALALRTSGRATGVSRLHGEVANGIWRSLLESDGLKPIESVTNGVHACSWIGPEMVELMRKHLGATADDHGLDPGFADAIQSIPDYELWTAHLAQKRRLVEVIRERTLQQFARQGRSPRELRQVDSFLDPDALTIGFARRFATYKRADLLLRDPARLNAMVGDGERPVQILFAGKAHPADRPGQELIRRIWQASRTPELKGRVLFVEDYDLRLARNLVQGVDLWLNTPRRPLEASGTSGMKAALNGVLNCSILDGWWCEGFDASHGWSIGDGDEGGDDARDAADAESLYRVLGEEVVPAYYQRNEQGLPVAWIRRMKLAMGMLTPRFGTARMVREYVEKYYLPASRGELD